VQEQGIHPFLERLIYLTEEEFKIFKRLREEFLKKTGKITKHEELAEKEAHERPVEERSTREQGLKLARIGHEFQRIWKNREDDYFRWVRVGEYFKELKQEQTYEWQGKYAEKIKRSFAYNNIINY
jgi:hypothetical protein